MIFHLDGGAGTNFGVVAYESEEILLAQNPSLNTIGVVTSVPFSKWRFDALEPDDAADGDLWFKTGDPVVCDAAFSAIAGNTVMVYPIAALQRRNGSWEEIPARSYQEKDGSAQWVSWIKNRIYLVQNGALKVEFQKDSSRRMSITQGDTAVTFRSSANSGYAVVVLDLTHYSKLIIDGTKFSGHSGNKVGVWSMDKTVASNTHTAGAPFSGASGLTEVDISELTGEFQVGMTLLGGETFEAVVTDFYLQRS